MIGQKFKTGNKSFSNSPAERPAPVAPQFRKENQKSENSLKDEKQSRAYLSRAVEHQAQRNARQTQAITEKVTGRTDRVPVNPRLPIRQASERQAEIFTAAAEKPDLFQEIKTMTDTAEAETEKFSDFSMQDYVKMLAAKGVFVAQSWDSILQNSLKEVYESTSVSEFLDTLFKDGRGSSIARKSGYSNEVPAGKEKLGGDKFKDILKIKEDDKEHNVKQFGHFFKLLNEVISETDGEQRIRANFGGMNFSNPENMTKDEWRKTFTELHRLLIYYKQDKMSAVFKKVFKEGSNQQYFKECNNPHITQNLMEQIDKWSRKSSRDLDALI